MHRFWNIIIEPVLTMLGPEVVVEIGSDQGKNTVRLLEFCKNNNAVLHVVDPLPKFDVDALKKQYGRHFVFHKSLSLNAIPKIKAADVFLIDGDHNWYTVFNELKLIEKYVADAKRPFPVVMLHDIAWPYGRRDLYYNPETIPDKFRKPYKQKGIRPDSAELLEEGGLNQHLNNSIYENDQQSGVLTAVDDFIKETEQSIELLKLPGLSGLGILVPFQLKEHNKKFRAFLETFDMGHLINNYIEEIESVRIQTELSLYNTEVLVSRKNKEIKIIKEERNEKIQKLSEEQSLEIQKLSEEQRFEMSRLKKEQKLEIEHLQGELEKRDRWVDQVSYGISELLNSKRWKTGVALGELYRKVLFRPQVPTVADHIQELIEKLPGKNRSKQSRARYAAKKNT